MRHPTCGPCAGRRIYLNDSFIRRIARQYEEILQHCAGGSVSATQCIGGCGGVGGGDETD